MESASATLARERGRLDRAIRHEEYTRRIKALSEQIARNEAATVDVAPLRKMLELAADIPKSFMARGARTLGWSMPFVPVRDMVIFVCSHAIEREADAQAKRDREIAIAREEIAVLEKGIAEVLAEESAA